jgi:hypothetical protein
MSKKTIYIRKKERKEVTRTEMKEQERERKKNSERIFL